MYHRLFPIILSCCFAFSTNASTGTHTHIALRSGLELSIRTVYSSKEPGDVEGKPEILVFKENEFDFAVFNNGRVQVKFETDCRTI